MPSLSIYLITLSLLLFLGCSKDREAEIFYSIPKNEGASVANKNKTDGNSRINDLPVGKQRFWRFDTGHRADLDRAYANQTVNILTNAFGIPLEKRMQKDGSVWLYDKMRVNHQGTNYSKVNVVISQGRVVKIYIDPSSFKKTEGNTNQ